MSIKLTIELPVDQQITREMYTFIEKQGKKLQSTIEAAFAKKGSDAFVTPDADAVRTQIGGTVYFKNIVPYKETDKDTGLSRLVVIGAGQIIVKSANVSETHYIPAGSVLMVLEGDHVSPDYKLVKLPGNPKGSKNRRRKVATTTKPLIRHAAMVTA